MNVPFQALDEVTADGCGSNVVVGYEARLVSDAMA